MLGQEEEKGGGGGGKRQGMLAVNDLNYVLAPDLSVAVNSTFKNHFFQSSKYTNSQRAICLLNSGADYADCRSSTLNFVVSFDSNPNGNIGWFGRNGSALNLIKSITVSSRSGDEISRTIDLNHLSVMQNGFRYSANWMKTVGQTIGVGGGLMQSDSVMPEQQFCIPLYLLSDFFAYGRLLPAMVLGGLRIEIEWETPATAFQAITTVDNDLPGGTLSGYTISNPYIALRSVQLTDGVQRALNELSAVNGLEIVYCDYERTEQSLQTDQTLHLEVRKAASRALKAILSVRPSDNINDVLKDSFKTEPFDYTNWQWQLGSLYFPQQPVKALNSIPSLIIPESYQRTLVGYGTFKGDQPRCSAIPLRETGDFLESNFAANKSGFLESTLTSTGATTWQASGGDVNNHIGVGSVFFVQPTNAQLGTITQQPQMYTVRSIEGATDFTAFPDHAGTATAGASWGLVSDTGYGVNTGAVESTPWAQHRIGNGDVETNIDGKDGTFANGRSTITCLLERSDLFNLTGVPINNSRVLSAHANFATGAINRTATIFLKYVRLARVFLNNVEVEQ